MAELADFEPSDGHRHSCDEHTRRACDCASELYAVAQDAEAALARVRAVLDEHWDWKAGRSLHAAVTKAIES